MGRRWMKVGKEVDEGGEGGGEEVDEGGEEVDEGGEGGG